MNRQPWKTEPENAPGRGAADLFNVKAESLKQFRTHLCDRSACFAAFAVARLQNFSGEKIRVYDATHSALLVHDRECEKFVEDKKFAGLKNRRRRGNRHN